MAAIKVSDVNVLTPSDYSKVRMELFEKIGTGEYKVRYEAALTFLQIAINSVIGTATADFDTLGKIQGIIALIQTALDNKVDKNDVPLPEIWNPIEDYVFNSEIQQYVSYVNEESEDPQFNTEGFYRLLSDTVAGQSPETHPAKWAYQGQAIGELVIEDIVGLVEALNNKINVSEKAAVNGVATLDSGGKVPSAQLPASSLANVIANKGVGLSASKPVTGLTVGDIFVSTDSLLKFTATGSTTWDAGVALSTGVLINDTSLTVNLLYQYNGTVVKLTGDGGGGHVIQENSVSSTARSKMNFVSANGQDVVKDDAANDQTGIELTILSMNDLNATGKSASSLLGVNSINGGHEYVQVTPFVEILRNPEANINANTVLSTSLDAGYKIDSIIIKNQTANAAGNISIGTEALGAQIVNAQTVEGVSTPYDCTLVKAFFSDVNATDLYISSSAWGTGIVTIYFTFKKVI